MSLSVHGLHVVHAVHGKSGKNHENRNPGVDDPKDLQTNTAHVAGPTVYSCGIRGIMAETGRVLHKRKANSSFLMSSLAAPIVSADGAGNRT